MKNKTKKSPRLLNKRDNQLVGLAFVSPFLVGFVLVFAKMLFDGVRAAFSTASLGDTGMVYQWAGFENFRYALRVDPQYISFALDDLKSLIFTIPLIMIFSLFIAVVLNNKIWGRTFFRVVFFLPVIIATGLLTRLDASNAVMTSMTEAATSGSDSLAAGVGDITTFLQSLQFSPGLIKTVSSIANNVVDIVTQSGVQILIFLAGIQSISPSIYEAASVEGASEWEKFWKITLPMVSPMIVVNLVYTVIECLTNENTSLMGYIKYNAFTGGKFGEAAAMAWLYFVAVIVLLLVVYLIIRRLTKLSKTVK